jgi:four helix bundle protein
MGFNFEKLNVWQMAINLASDIHIISKSFPKDEMFSLTSQLRRATDSISLNIAEGATDNSKPEFKRFLTMSSRSCAEVISCLYHARNRKYIDDEKFLEFYSKTEIIYKMINKLKNSI